MSLSHESPTELHKILKHQFTLYYEILKHTEKEELELKQEYTANDDMTCEGAEVGVLAEEFSDLSSHDCIRKELITFLKVLPVLKDVVVVFLGIMNLLHGHLCNSKQL